MSQVYSTQLLKSAGTPGTYSFDVPAGFVCVVRDLDVVVQPTLSMTFALGVAGCAIYEVVSTGLDVATSFQWRGRQVANFGQAVTVFTSDVASFVLSGYLLTLP